MSKKTWNACNTCRICISNKFWNGWWIEVNIRRYQQARKVSAFFRRHFSRRSFGDKRATEQQICIFTSLRLCGKRFPCVCMCACFLGIFTSSLSDVYYFTPKRLFYGVTVTPMMPQRFAKPLNDSVLLTIKCMCRRKGLVKQVAHFIACIFFVTNRSENMHLHHMHSLFGRLFCSFIQIAKFQEFG